MENNEVREEDKMIWNTLNSHEKEFKRVDKNIVILFILVILTLIVAAVK